MADQPAATTLAAPFPAPPSFYHSFTSENLARLRDWETTGASNEEIPDELRYLRPPTPPTNGVYNIFGEERSVSHSNIPVEPALYPS